MTSTNEDNYRISYAQNREDILLAAFFPGIDKGFYVDIGANDPLIDSVTYYFYKKGWNGINVEPQEVHYNSLLNKRARDINLNIGIGEKAGTLQLRQYSGDGLSTFSDDMKHEYDAEPNSYTKDYDDISVKVLPLKDVLKLHSQKEIHFMKVDVEGFEYEVLASNDWKKYRPMVICIEANHVRNDWHELLDEQQYHLTFFDGLNEYFIDSTNPKIKGSFSYVESVVLGKPITPRLVAEHIDNQEALITDLSQKLSAAENSVKALTDELESSNGRVLYLQNELDKIVSLRKHIDVYAKKKVHALDSRIQARIASSNVFLPVQDAPVAKSTIEAAHTMDKQNYEKFLQTGKDNIKVKLYQRAKHSVKKVIRK